MPTAFKDRIIPWYFVMFFIIVVAVNSVMVTLAIRTSTGLVTDHPYEKGVAYNQVLNAIRHQKELGWKGVISYQSKIPQQGTLTFALTDAQGTFLHAQKISLHISRPVKDGFDFDQTMLLSERSTYEANVTFPQPGLWEARVIAYSDGNEVQYTQRLVIQ
ncbi:MAG: FixH family protein [Alphaproteobacteria bacterium]|nr:FixH family protein [Alphaproteobacteria bacterium]